MQHESLNVIFQRAHCYLECRIVVQKWGNLIQIKGAETEIRRTEYQLVIATCFPVGLSAYANWERRSGWVISEIPFNSKDQMSKWTFLLLGRPDMSLVIN